MAFLGIDNGLDGALVSLSGKVAVTLPMPTLKSGTKRVYDFKAISDWLKQDFVALCVLEKAQAMPGQGVTSMFSIGVGFGAMQGILSSLSISYEVKHPRTWQKVICGDIAGDTKQRALLAVKRLFPDVELRATDRCRKPHDGIVDALCMAEYARRIYGK